ncbi:uncharacterized protein [Chelonus insularis]|uniref:uncharacterized protein n=1 Tax=Chelonus insularis TaxID=460826 RepID=UPI00158B170B|nr:uncharacterized protein LOC118073017 [Chelonus insularis]
MQRFLQVLFFITIISAVFASSALPDGCNEGKVWTTASQDHCYRCECRDNLSHCTKIPQPCQAEGSFAEFHSYPYIPEPPSGQLFHGSTDGPSNPWTGTTEPEPKYDQTVGIGIPSRFQRTWKFIPPTPVYIENPAYKK